MNSIIVTSPQSGSVRPAAYLIRLYLVNDDSGLGVKKRVGRRAMAQEEREESPKDY